MLCCHLHHLQHCVRQHWRGQSPVTCSRALFSIILPLFTSLLVKQMGIWQGSCTGSNVYSTSYQQRYVFQSLPGKTYVWATPTWQDFGLQQSFCVQMSLPVPTLATRFLGFSVSFSALKKPSLLPFPSFLSFFLRIQLFTCLKSYQQDNVGGLGGYLTMHYSQTL